MTSFGNMDGDTVGQCPILGFGDGSLKLADVRGVAVDFHNKGGVVDIFPAVLRVFQSINTEHEETHKFNEYEVIQRGGVG